MEIAKFKKYTTIPKELLIKKKPLHEASFRLLRGVLKSKSLEDVEEQQANENVSPVKIEQEALDNELNEEIKSELEGISKADFGRHSRSEKQLLGGVAIEMNPYTPISFGLRKKLLRQCLDVRPKALCRSRKGSKTSIVTLGRTDDEREDLTAAENAIHRLIAPRGLGKLQTWIDRRRRGIEVLPNKNNPFGYESKDTYERRWSAMLDGPPHMDNGWMGNTIAPTYTTAHRDSFQVELCPLKKSIHSPAVVRLGYGHLDALERRYTTSYRDMFRHPDSYITKQ